MAKRELNGKTRGKMVRVKVRVGVRVRVKVRVRVRVRSDLHLAFCRCSSRFSILTRVLLF